MQIEAAGEKKGRWVQCNCREAAWWQQDNDIEI